jgi:hypothetical protein
MCNFTNYISLKLHYLIIMLFYREYFTKKRKGEFEKKYARLHLLKSPSVDNLSSINHFCLLQ